MEASGQNMRTIEAVLFDLGDTLIDYGRVNVSHLFDEGAKRSYEYLRSLDQPVGSAFFYSLRNLLAIRWHYLLSQFKRKDFDSLELLRKIGTRGGYTMNAQQWEDLSWQWYAPLGEAATAEPDLAQSMEKLKEQGLKIGIVSNTFVHKSTLEKHLDSLGIRDMFDLRIYSYECGLRKPDPRIFQRAAERIGVEPARILFVGDRIDKDIRPALKAGMLAAMKQAHSNAGKTLPEGAFRIKKISELPPLVDKINANEMVLAT